MHALHAYVYIKLIALQNERPVDVIQTHCTWKYDDMNVLSTTSNTP